MNAPLRTPAPLGTAAAYREAIAEALSMVRIQAELGETYALLADDAGLHYAMRKLAAQAGFALGTLSDLEKMKIERARRKA
jgi:hypothetical protein